MGWLAVGTYLLTLPPARLLLARRHPVLQVSPATLDLGSLWTPGHATGRWTLRNAGGSPLHLQDVQGSQPLRAMPREWALAPGLATLVRVELDSGSLAPGPFRGNVTLDSDDPAGPQHVAVVAQVRPLLQGPPALSLQGLVTHRPRRVSLHLAPAEPALALQVAGWRSTLECVKVLESLPKPGGWSLAIEVTPPSVGRLEGTLEVTLGQPYPCVVPVPVSLEVVR